MAGEDGVAEVVEALTAALALVALAVRLGLIPAILDDRGGGTMRAGDPVRPPHVPDGLVALGVVEEVLDVHHRATPQSRFGRGSSQESNPTARPIGSIITARMPRRTTT